jgi:uncharacterized RDD family membrane protein YckC
VARLGRRILAILVDWAIASGLAALLLGYELLGTNPFPPLIVFGVLQVVFIATFGGSPGHLVLGLRVVPLKPAWVGVLKPLVRTALLCLAIPAVMPDVDQRGLHDRLAGTVLVRR